MQLNFPYTRCHGNRPSSVRCFGRTIRIRVSPEDVQLPVCPQSPKGRAARCLWPMVDRGGLGPLSH
jgi:hypothetical protein